MSVTIPCGRKSTLQNAPGRTRRYPIKFYTGGSAQKSQPIRHHLKKGTPFWKSLPVWSMIRNTPLPPPLPRETSCFFLLSFKIFKTCFVARNRGRWGAGTCQVTGLEEIKTFCTRNLSKDFKIKGICPV